LTINHRQSKTEDMPLTNYDEIAKDYDAIQGETGDPLHSQVLDPAIESILGEYQGQTVLDAGCGNGYWCRKLAKQAGQVVGIDSSPFLIDLAKQKDNPPNVNFEVVTLESRLNFEDEQFDLVLSSMVLHYLEDIQTAARELFRVLKPGSKCVIATQHPNYPFYFSATEDYENKFLKKPPGYFERQPLDQITYGTQFILRTYNHTLQDYVQAFTDAGFALDKLLEPEFTPEFLEKNPRYQPLKNVPRVIVFRFKKI
jgi:ubiquinone/menaquinone biosynthesis C-methylase UbiE